MSNEISLDEILSHKDSFTSWNFQCPEDEFYMTGYEDVLGVPGEWGLKKYNSVAYYQADKQGKKDIVSYVADIYESKGIFPIRYFSNIGAQNEVMRVIQTPAAFDGDTVSVKSNAGTTLCSWMFPNLFKTPSSQEIGPDGQPWSSYDKFYSRIGLEKIISFCFEYNYMGDKDIANTGIDPLAVTSPKYPATNALSGIRMTGSVPTNFRPLNARAIYEHLCPKEGAKIFDPCMGFSGRMVGALTSKYNYTYEGTDPNTETIYNLNRMGKLLESVTGREDSYKLHCCGSEDFVGEPGTYDFAFTSPPYFDLELYGSDGGDFNSDNQSHVRYPTLDVWLEGYVRQTIRNLNVMLKKRALYAINIADFKVGSRTVNYVDEWKRISAEEGMPLVDTLFLGVQARAGSSHLGDSDFGAKKENILVFKKKKNI